MELQHWFSRSRLVLLRDAAVVATAVFFAVLALDDITTDQTAPGFIVERLVLLCCALGLLAVSFRLLGDGHRLLGGLSLVALVGAAVGQQQLSPGTVWAYPLAYGATMAGLVWFITLAGLLTIGHIRGAHNAA